MKSNRKELSNKMKEHEKKEGELWTNMGTGRTCEARVPPSFFASFNFCSSSKYGVVT